MLLVLAFSVGNASCWFDRTGIELDVLSGGLLHIKSRVRQAAESRVACNYCFLLGMWYINQALYCLVESTSSRGNMQFINDEKYTIQKLWITPSLVSF
jgi:hypothetical protein